VTAGALAEEESPVDGGPAIPVGLGTTLGALGTMILGVAALVSAVLGGDHTAETLGALASAAVVLVATIAGRFAQAYAIYRSLPPLPSTPPVGTTYQPSPPPERISGSTSSDTLASARRARTRPPERP
jgi:hypothetical protein